MEDKISVIGLTGNGNNLTLDTLGIINNSDVILGSNRLLDLIDAAKIGVELIELKREIRETIEYACARFKGKNITILASGDPLYHGVGETLIDMEKVANFYPALTTFQEVFAKLNLAWGDAKLFSLHGTKHNYSFLDILNADKSVIYGDKNFSVQKLSAKLIEFHAKSKNRKAYAICNFNMQNEIIKFATLEDFAKDNSLDQSLSILILLDGKSSNKLPLPLGLNDDNYLHVNKMITHPEVRAIVISKLELMPNNTLWDLGAASGSVSIEAAKLVNSIKVHSCEKNGERFEHLLTNITNSGVNNITPYNIDAIDAIKNLPQPDRIFIGGGGKDLLEKAFDLLANSGILVMTGVTLESIALMSSVLIKYRSELINVNISRAANLTLNNTIVRSDNPITIAVFKKEIYE